MNNDQKLMIFYSGWWSHIIFWYFENQFMGGRMGGAPTFHTQTNTEIKKSRFLGKKCFICVPSAPPAPHHVCRKLPPHPPPPFKHPSIRPPMIAPPVALKMCLFPQNEVNPWDSWNCVKWTPPHTPPPRPTVEKFRMRAKTFHYFTTFHENAFPWLYRPIVL